MIKFSKRKARYKGWRYEIYRWRYGIRSSNFVVFFSVGEGKALRQYIMNDIDTADGRWFSEVILTNGIKDIKVNVFD